MGFGKHWGVGHGQELWLVSQALNKARASDMRRFRKSLNDNEPIMKALHPLLARIAPLTRTNDSTDEPLADWDIWVTQFRWFDDRANFWLNATSTPFEIDQIMRRTFLACCDLHRDGWRSFQFAGQCEHPELRVDYGMPSITNGDPADATVTFWIYGPDHWGSEDNTGHETEPRDLRGFIKPPSSRAPAGAISVEPLGEKHEPRSVHGPAAVVGGRAVQMTRINWDRSLPTESTKRPRRLEIPPSEQRRLDELSRLAEFGPEPVG